MAVELSSQKGTAPITTGEAQRQAAMQPLWSIQDREERKKEKKKKGIFVQTSLFKHSENFELCVDWFDAQPKAGDEEQHRALRFWFRGCNPASWLNPTEGLRATQTYACSVHHRITLQQWPEGAAHPCTATFRSFFCGSYKLSSSAQETQDGIQLAGAIPQLISWKNRCIKKVQYPWLLGLMFIPQGIQTDPVFPLLAFLAENTTWFIWEGRGETLFFFFKITLNFWSDNGVVSVHMYWLEFLSL